MTEDQKEEFAAALAEVLTQFGRRVVDKPDQLRGALSDTLGSTAAEHRSEVDGVVAASRVGVAGQIRDADPQVAASPEQVREWFDQLVSAGVSLRDAALATRSWAEVFDASETARVTSELSSEILGPDAGAPAASVGSVSREAEPRTADLPSGAGGVAAASLVRGPGNEDQTDLTDGSVLGGFESDRTRAAGTVEQTPLGAAAPAQPAQPAPSPAPDLAEDRAEAQNDLPRNRLLAFWPAAGAVVAIALTLGIGVPMIAANAAPRTLPAPEPVQISEDTGLFDRRDVAQFALDQDLLAQLVPEATSTFGPSYHSPDGYGLGFTASDAKCAGAFSSIAPADANSSAAFASTANDQTNWLWVDSVTRWYASAEEAAIAMEALSPEGCGAPASLNNGVSFAAKFEVAEPTWVNGVKIVRSTTTAVTTPPWVLQRHCYLDENIVTCVSVSGTDTASLGESDEALIEVLDERLTTVVPFREQK